MWSVVSAMLVMGCLSFSYFAYVAWRMPSDGPLAEALLQKQLDKYPGATGELMGRMAQVAAPITRHDRARPYAVTAAVLAVLAVVAFLLA